MSALQAVATGSAITLSIGLAVWGLSRRRAIRLVNQMLQKEEHRDTEVPYVAPSGGGAAPTSNNNGPERVVMVAPAGLYNKMTVRTRMLGLGLSLVELGHNVTIVIPAWDCPKRSGLQKDLGPLAVIDVQSSRWARERYDPVLLARLLHQVLALKPDVIYCFKSVGYAAAVSLLTYALRHIPWVKTAFGLDRIRVTVDTDNWEGFGGWADRRDGQFISKLLRDRQEQLSLRYCDSVTVTSDELRTRISAMRNDSQTVTKIKNGIMGYQWPDQAPPTGPPVELERRLADLGGPDLLLVYTKFAEFEAETLIDILARVLRQVPNAALLIVGTSFDADSRTERLKLPLLADERGIGRDRIISAGWIRYSELRSYWALAEVAIYPMSDTLVNRSICPTKLLELMADAKAVVAHAVGEIESIIEHDSNGLLVPAGENGAFAASAVQLLQDADLRKRLGDVANDSVHSSYDWAAIAPDVVAALQLGRTTPFPAVEGL